MNEKLQNCRDKNVRTGAYNIVYILVSAVLYQICHCEERSDVAISSIMLSPFTAPIHIAYFRFSMLISMIQFFGALQEIPTSGLRPSSE